MTLLEAIDRRHSVRAYLAKPIPEALREQLNARAAEYSREGRLNISIQYDDPEGFDSRLAHYGRFRNVNNYIVLAGAKDGDFDYRCGYWGERLVLYAQQLGLNTCWVALTFNKRRVKRLVDPGERLCMVIALGYGENQGAARRSKAEADVVDSLDGKPDWFRRGVAAALKAPTAVNQQKFLFALDGDTPTLRVKGLGTCTKVDLGIAAFHFEAASGRRVRPIL